MPYKIKQNKFNGTWSIVHAKQTNFVYFSGLTIWQASDKIMELAKLHQGK